MIEERTARDLAPALAQLLNRLDVAHRRIRSGLAGGLGLGASEFSALVVIGRTGRSTPSEIGAELRLTSGAVTAVLDRLEARGFISRQLNREDRRSVVLQLEERGVEARRWTWDGYLSAVEAALEQDESLGGPRFAAQLQALSEAVERTSASLPVFDD